MGKYDPLSERLAAEAGAHWEARFTDVEEVLGTALPQAARVDGGWWRADETAPHARAWLERGWWVAAVDPEAETVRFERPGLPVATPTKAAVKKPGRGMAIGAGLAVGAVSVLGLALALRVKRGRTEI